MANEVESRATDMVNRLRESVHNLTREFRCIEWCTNIFQLRLFVFYFKNLLGLDVLLSWVHIYYCSYKHDAAKLITVHVIMHTITNYFRLYYLPTYLPTYLLTYYLLAYLLIYSLHGEEYYLKM